jgi:hypothetical protein
MSDQPPTVSAEQTFIELDAGSEWRFELEADENIAIRVSHAWSAIESVVGHMRHREVSLTYSTLRSTLMSRDSW